jgi:pteridine reductase
LDVDEAVGGIALVTGGAIRVGRAISLGLAKSGYDLVINYRSSHTAARELQERVRSMGRRVVLAPGDVSHAADVDGIAATVEQEFGRLDVLVNSASLFRARSLLEVDEAEWDRVMGVNLKGPFLMVRELARLLRTSRGTVVNIVDLSALRPWDDFPHHSVAKAGLLHLTRVMARVLAPEVRVNAVAPGNVLAPEGFSERWLEEDRRRTPLQREGTPEDVVRTVLFLVRSPFITGEVIVVDGGRQLTS